MEKRKVTSFNLNEIPERKLKFVGKGMFVWKHGDAIDIYKRHFNVNPQKTLVLIIVVSFVLGILIGALLWS